ncbi:MAG: hypothetical protein HPY85_06885 [Anaerolineae bacterium]|nr:hypothetical protein [Anaerolineae bacterium]
MSWTPTQIDRKVKIGGVDVTAYVAGAGNEAGLAPMMIAERIDQQYDTADFSLEDAAGVAIEEWDEVVITNAAETETYFAGYLTRMQPAVRGIALDVVCAAEDYSIRFEKSVVNKRWQNAEDTTILAWIRENAQPDLTDFDFSTHVTGLGETSITFSDKTVRDALNKLALRMNARWYVDWDKKLHWFAGNDSAAPFMISDDPDFVNSFPCVDPRIERRGGGMVNRVKVKGGSEPSDLTTHVYSGDGQQTLFVVPYAYEGPDDETGIVVEVNSGSDASPVWTAVDVGAKYLHDSEAGYEVLFSPAERFFEFITAPADLKSSWRVTAVYQVPIITRLRNDASIEQYGLTLEKVIRDSSISTSAEAQARGLVELAMYAAPRVTYRFGCYQTGLHVGQVLRFVDSVQGVDEEIVIQELQRSDLGGGFEFTRVTAGDYVADLNDLMYALLRSQEDDTDFDAETILDEILSLGERIKVGDVYGLTEKAGPYEWAPADNEIVWDEFVWA